MPILLRCLGAAGTVTGSRYLLQVGTQRVLVDCGLFQGVKALRQRNWLPLPVPAQSIDAVLLTHAHVDHSGFLPVLVKQGFRGKIFCSSATRDLCAILLADAAHLQEEDARHANRHGYSKHKPALPLYTVEEAKRAMAQFSPIEMHRSVEIVTGVRARFHVAGHILGACSVHVSAEGTSVLFSGDVGRSKDALTPAPETPEAADYVVIESTYGDRRHTDFDAKAQLAHVVNETAARNGVLIVPAFSVGRAQLILHYLHQLRVERRIAHVPVFLNSPMAASVLRVYQQHRSELRLSASECDALCATAHVVASVEESKALNGRSGPMIIIAGSGMATGGRVVHHLEQFASDARNTVLLVGYQAPGTRGGQLVSGVEEMTIHGRQVPLRAEVVQMEQLSAHADCVELVQWLRALGSPPRMVFVTHGEPAAADALRHRIETQLRYPCTVPTGDNVFTIGSNREEMTP